MNHFSRLVFTASSITLLIGSTSGWAAGPEKGGPQLVPVGQDTQALLSHSSQGYLGIEIREIDNDRASALKLKSPTGAEITYVDRDAPAGKAGLRVHDVILQMNGQQVQGIDQLRRMLHEIPAGRSVSLVISRDGQQQTITAQLADRTTLEQDAWSQHLTVPEPGDDTQPMMGLTGPTGHGFSGSSGFFGSFTISPSYVGVQLDTLGSQLADYFGVKDGQGLLVKRVEDNSPAAAAGLKAGDVITKVNGQVMATLNEWGKTIHANRGKQIQVTIVRNRKEQTVNMQAGDGKHKGEMVMPGAFQDLKPEIDATMAEQIDSGEMSQEMMMAMNDAMSSIDPEELGAEISQSMQGIDTEKLQQELQEQQKQIRQQILEQLKMLQEHGDLFQLHRMD